MEIEFNTRRIPQADFSQPVTQPGDSPAADDAASISAATSLATKMNDIPLARPEQVDQARILIAHAKYPPDDVLDRIAILLAAHLNP